MALHYCPQCGAKLQPGFRFCPTCGEKLPQLPEPEPEPAHSIRTLSLNPTTDSPAPHTAAVVEASGCSAMIRSPIRSVRQSATKILCSPATPPPPATHSTDQKFVKSPGKRRSAFSKVQEEKESTVSAPSPQTPPPALQGLTSPWKRKLQEDEELKTVSPPPVQTPPSAKGRGKKVKRVCVVEPEEGAEFCDQSGKKWRLEKLLIQSDVELTYTVQQAGGRVSSDEWKHILRMGAKEGQLFSEQNFLQRAAKPTAVEKWMKKFSLDFLGIPSCVGFGVHESYRFLVFEDLGRTLQEVMGETLPERTVLQVALRLLDALEFIHENEYAHADLHAGNVYISTSAPSRVFLSGFGHAFRFCPGGKHVEYREGSRTPHQGNLNFISLDSHKGAGPSRRSDLQSLGFCLLCWMTGSLPWSDATPSGSVICAEKEKYMADVLGLMSSCFKKRRISGGLQSYLSQVVGLHY
ncbi:inactive serine/threonine-protein kinase VRK3 [Astyanax mexicanus]|uniref:inactive serine/threonine-protein kinase VRK3 n=1 Tax=Astyanax mexicanus TaxID=7994 RepID=UPI0020CB0A71|nr:inactive serine/threonine-protein kinase VRK3 [Astyanax mexicanus]